MDLVADVAALATEAGRLPGTPGHDDARTFLLRRFREIGLQPYAGMQGFVHEYYAVARPVTLRSLIGVVPGDERSLPPVVVAAHYDSVISAPSADDNAAAVAVMLAVAERVAAEPLRRDVIVAAFDAEEPPFFLSEDMGSVRFVADVLEPPVHLAVVMDLIGHPVIAGPLPIDPGTVFVTGAESHPSLPALFDGLTTPIVATRNDRVGDMSDHHAFRVTGAPYLFFSCGEWPAYHTPADRIEGLDFAKMQRFAGDLETLVRHSDGVATKYHADHDSTDFEVATMERGVSGEALDAAAALLGVPNWRTREGLDRLIPAIRERLWAG